MVRALRNILRLLTIVRTLARHGALDPRGTPLEGAFVAPTLLVIMRVASQRRHGFPTILRPGERLATALSKLGPVFIKLGQMLSTRSDLLGDQVAADLSRLQDRLDPFPADAARAMIESELGRPVREIFESFEDRPVSAASIAQVHYATVAEGDGTAGREVAVKVLRPGIEAAFARDIDLLAWIAALIERTQPRLRRFRPMEVVETFAATVRIEMDLRMEAAAAAELAANFDGDPTYRVPAVDWRRTARRVLTQERLSGIPMDDAPGLRAAGIDIDAVLARAAAIFFKQVFRDGYFHGDQHPGNMFVDPDGNIGAVDFGIMGRLDRPTRYYLADMLLAFLERDYRRIADIHFVAGYVPATQSREMFAQACRAIGEPILGRPLNEISFAHLLAQLFRVTEAFEMEAQPQLLLLQKNMLMAEGVSRRLNPDLNIWTLAQPLIEEWMREHRGPEARLREAFAETMRSLQRLPSLIRNLDRAAARGLPLHPAGIEHLAGYRRPPMATWLVWVATAALMLALLLS